MIKRILFVTVCLSLSLLPLRVNACAGHMYFNPDELGFVGGTIARMAGLAPAAPVFDLEYPQMTKAVIGDNNVILINYSRPFFSKNVRLTLKPTNNVKLTKTNFELDDRSGTITIGYQVIGAGYNTITMIVSGVNKGETVSQSVQIYVRAIEEPSGQELQVSER